eukprot:TRINITY_DN4168_c0_g1_i1.p1 TRINITY_DN4168_c0_g1~~TRINITY_DN4168_c0_g1_i1.p1  ORF type:complete len:477 (+),score=101.87 TRINITY_DN4168_c0_g1_i1:256-1686(+)
MNNHELLPKGVVLSDIECGEVVESGSRSYRKYVEFFGGSVEVFYAVVDQTRTPLFRPVLMSEKLNCHNSRVGMFIHRRRDDLHGVFQASGYVYKSPGVIGLKLGAYFISLDTCEKIETWYLGSKSRSKILTTDDLQEQQQQQMMMHRPVAPPASASASPPAPVIVSETANPHPSKPKKEIVKKRRTFKAAATITRSTSSSSSELAPVIVTAPTPAICVAQVVPQQQQQQQLHSSPPVAASFPSTTPQEHQQQQHTQFVIINGPNGVGVIIPAAYLSILCAQQAIITPQSTTITIPQQQQQQQPTVQLQDPLAHPLTVKKESAILVEEEEEAAVPSPTSLQSAASSSSTSPSPRPTSRPSSILQTPSAGAVHVTSSCPSLFEPALMSLSSSANSWNHQHRHQQQFPPPPPLSPLMFQFDDDMNSYLARTESSGSMFGRSPPQDQPTAVMSQAELIRDRLRHSFEDVVNLENFYTFDY